MAKAPENILSNSSIAENKRAVQRSAKKRTSAAAMTESVFACKWSARILNLIRQGVKHPGAITLTLDGLSTKVLNEWLRRLMDLGLVERTPFPEIPPHVEYKLTGLGERFVTIFDAVEELQTAIDKYSVGRTKKKREPV